MDSVQKRFSANGGGPPLEVLRDASLRIAAGESVAIVGPSGSGKSTILNLIGALDRPDGGRIQVGDRDLSSLDDLALARFRNRTVGFVFQAHHLLSHCTVWENVLVPALAEASSVDAATEERARRLLKRVGLEDRMGHRPGQLSGGERQRAAVVRALINEPGLLLADEPTGALDRASASELARLLLELNREQHLTLVLVTHAPDLARQMGRVLELRDGRLHPAG
jgi:ABC-type lipoprotein export system ATPase subunit